MFHVPVLALTILIGNTYYISVRGKEMDGINLRNSFCAWIDLLGYGAAFYKSDWDLHAQEAINNLYRIKKLEPILHSISNPFCETLFSMNDGIIRNFDIPQNDALMIMQWLVDVLLKFKLLNDWDISNGFYGSRGVVTFGMRAQYRDYDTIGKGDLIQTSPQRREEYNKTKIIYTPNEMQMNTAFSKAYIIESGGSSKGLLKNRIHLDEKMLDKFVCYINQSKPTEFGLTDEDFEENGPCICKYNAFFEKCKKVLTVTANVNDATWDCLRIEFDNVIPYENDKQALTTHLFTPKRVFDSLYSPHDSGILEL